MIKVPIFGDYYNTIMPIFIIVFGLIFALLSVLKLKNKAIQALKNYSEGKNKSDESKAKKNNSDLTLA